jgi:hypothetical protein
MFAADSFLKSNERTEKKRERRRMGGGEDRITGFYALLSIVTVFCDKLSFGYT